MFAELDPALITTSTLGREGLSLAHASPHQGGSAHSVSGSLSGQGWDVLGLGGIGARVQSPWSGAGEAEIQPFRQGSQQTTQLGFYSHARQKLAKKHHLIKPDKHDCSL